MNRQSRSGFICKMVEDKIYIDEMRAYARAEQEAACSSSQTKLDSFDEL